MKIKQMPVCPACVAHWVDRATATSGVEVTDAERRQLIAGLLARRHLLLTGPAGVGKHRLARALAAALVEGRTERLRVLRGHPWWAAQTGDVNRFVFAQENYNLWRLADFVSGTIQTAGRAGERHTVLDLPFIVVIEKMSHVEADLYFRLLDRAGSSSLLPEETYVLFRLFGVLDAGEPPTPSDQIGRTVACVHFGRTFGIHPGGGNNVLSRDV